MSTTRAKSNSKPKGKVNNSSLDPFAILGDNTSPQAAGGGELIDDQLELVKNDDTGLVDLHSKAQGQQTPQQQLEAQQLSDVADRMDNQMATINALVRSVNGVRGANSELGGRLDDMGQLIRTILDRLPAAQPANQQNEQENREELRNPVIHQAQRQRDDRWPLGAGQQQPPPPQPPRISGLLNQEAISKKIVANIPKLDGNNYEIWSKRIADVVEIQQMTDHLERDITAERPNCATTRADDRSLFVLLDNLIEDGYRERLELAAETCYHLWNQLREANAYQSNLRKETDWMQFITLTRSGQSLPIGEYCDRAIGLYASLKRKKTTFDELFFYAFLGGVQDARFFRTQTMGAGASFIEQVENVRCKHTQQGEARDPVVCATRTQERRRPTERSRSPRERASQSRARIRLNSDQAGSSGEREPITCWNCGEQGHYASE